mmetsp:Transcript_12442/g.35614  ORF Transcript_12442/g.35614 Transcript_12442/m.35614 type:complete len:116 (-) Transcript_12442:239-586(-)
MLVGVNTEEGAAQLVSMGNVRASNVTTFDTSTEAGMEGLGNTLAKMELRRQPPPATSDMRSLPDTVPRLRSGPGTAAEKISEQSEVKTIDEAEMIVHPPPSFDDCRGADGGKGQQ